MLRFEIFAAAASAPLARHDWNNAASANAAMDAGADAVLAPSMPSPAAAPKSF